MSSTSNISVLTSAIKNANQHATPIMVLKYKAVYLPVLNLMVNNGFITSFFFISTFVVIKLKLGRQGRNKGLISMTKPARIGRKAAYTYHSLAKLQHREGGTPCYIFSTDRGITTGLNAINNHVGGKPLLRLV